MSLDIPNLLGCSIEDAKFKETQQVLEAQGPAETKDFKDATYVNYKRSGISFCFDKKSPSGAGVLGGIHVFNKGPQYEGCTLQLVHSDKVTLKMNAQQIVQLLGEPDRKSGGGSIPICLVYLQHGLQFELASGSWDDYTNRIQCLTFFKPE
eukprot:GDKI01045301.1.p1 GENE.GDKI01045301.1~~GDKI01045301.1.p1  ORF type:complete len:151 (-),score=29.92 GDKI01045301.1:75-527(-)